MDRKGTGIGQERDRNWTGRYRKETGKGPELEGKGMGHDEERAKKVIRRTRDGVLRLVYGITWGRAGTIQVLYSTWPIRTVLLGGDSTARPEIQR